MTTSSPISYRDYGFKSPEASHMHRHFMPIVMQMAGTLGPGIRVLDIGCGNGYTAGMLLNEGCDVTGVDLSEEGIDLARKTYPTGRFELMSADEHLLRNLDCEPFDLVVSTEVVEHLYAPRSFLRGAFSALKRSGKFICTTPYHGYLKNLAISLAGKWDSHANPLWDGGHIKLWSRKTLGLALREAGFHNLSFRGAGRLPFFWMTMVMSAEKP